MELYWKCSHICDRIKWGGAVKMQRLSQEWLKLVACLSMLIDHIGFTMVPQIGLRILGRPAFPLFCFLLSQGVHHTRNSQSYILRILILAVLSELPYDYMVFGQPSFSRQNVAFTLFLGIYMAFCLKKESVGWKSVVLVVITAIAAEVLRTDYGGYGIVLIAVFVLSEGSPHKGLICTSALLIMGVWMPGMGWQVGRVSFPIQLFGAAAMIPIWLYSGERSYGGWLSKWGFYVFYPGHMVVLCLLDFWCCG